MLEPTSISISARHTADHIQTQGGRGCDVDDGWSQSKNLRENFGFILFFS